MIKREPADRTLADIRPLRFELGVTRYAEGSVFVKAGHTHVLCNASIDEDVPSWLKNKGKGWVTAEYSMLPRATHTRTRRDREKVSGRTQEIQRLIGRALRVCVDLKKLGERQIIIDCDVIQADGGTRTASITGACIALYQAIRQLEKSGKIAPGAFVGTVAAISVGLKNGQVFTDLDYNEDASCGVDMNFVMTEAGKFVEIQGTAESEAFTLEEMGAMTASATQAIAKIRELQKAAMAASDARV